MTQAHSGLWFEIDSLARPKRMPPGITKNRFEKPEVGGRRRRESFNRGSLHSKLRQLIGSDFEEWHDLAD